MQETDSAVMADAAQKPAPRKMSGGLASSAATAAGVAALFAVGITLADGYVAYYNGSFLPWGIVGLVAAFWACAAFAGMAALALVLLPILRIFKIPARRAVMPAVAVAAGFAIHALVIRETISGVNPIAAEFLLNTGVLVALGAAFGAMAAFIAARTGRVAEVYAVAVVAALSAAAAAPFVPREARAFALVLAPPVFLALSGAAIELMKSRWAARVFAAAFTIACVAALFILGERTGQRPAAPIERPVWSAISSRPNVVLVVMDTLRADHTSMGGYRFPTTPEMGKLAKDAQVFANAVSVDSCTLPSHASIFTGLYPREHGAHADMERGPVITERYRPFFMPLAPSRRTLASYLSSVGYTTGAIAGNYARLCRQLGLSQGFQYYHDSPRLMLFTEGGSPVYKYGLDAIDRMFGRNGKLLQPYWSGKDVTRMAQVWVGERAQTPFFLFLNYMDPHYPYSAPPPFDHIDGPGISYNMAMRQDTWERLISRYINTGTGLDAKFLREVVNQYDGEIAYADHWLGELIETLKARGLYDDSLIIVTGDHGEFFGEHQYIDHSVAIYEEGVRVPLVVKYPKGAHAGEVKTERVSNMDVFATVLDAAGVPMPRVSAQPLDRTSHPVILENYESGLQAKRYQKRARRSLTAIYSGSYKYTKATNGQNELYDLSTDPGEGRNLVREKPDVAARLDAEIASWQARTPLFDARAEVGALLAPASSRGGAKEQGDSGGSD